MLDLYPAEQQDALAYAAQHPLESLPAHLIDARDFVPLAGAVAIVAAVVLWKTALPC